ncbi:hypothetical protein ACQP1V_42795 (plasmid) [Microtetraspora malaysiensis]|uniref:hypothetical protein n=1 Tax=Microtetraspora malaysiensis TaxID=161358 RepID=UPI003D9025F0
MAIDLVTRGQWGARDAKGAHTYLASTKGVKVHYTGGREDPRMVDDHDLCVARVRAIQRQHMDSNGWMDIGYSLCVCAHRKVFVGRGPHNLPAANGAGLNSGHYAVLGLVGNSGLVVPPPGMLHGIVDAIEYLRAHGGAGAEIKGHRDGYSTSCPGEQLYQWVKRGAPRPGGGTAAKPAPVKEEKDEMPGIVSLGLAKMVTVPAGLDYQPWWTQEWQDTDKVHPDGGQSIAPTSGMWADVTAHVALSGFAPDEPVQVGLTRHKADGALVDIAWPIGRLMTVHADASGRVDHTFSGLCKAGPDQRVRVMIRHNASGVVTLETSSAFKAVLHRV